MTCLHSFMLLIFGLAVRALPAQVEHERPVSILANHVLRLKTSNGMAEMPLDVSLNWNKPQPQVTRGVVMFHGKSRDVDAYYRALLTAALRADGDVARTSILVAPQFLIEEDARAHHLSADVLRWFVGSWESGAAASGPVSVSAFAVIDAITQHLGDQKLFPNLKEIVFAGHSGGGQAVQRYAVVGRAESISRPNIHLRYVVANPSSYLYFSDERPQFNNDSFRFVSESGQGCPNFNYWRYGIAHIQQEYVKQSAVTGWQTLEDAFAQKDVVYLLGTADVDPHQKDLDVSCAGEMQGPNRFLRGQAYYMWLRKRHPSGWNQQMWFVPHVAHSAKRMFTSECGVAALFERSSCTDH